MDYTRNDELLSAYLDRELSPDERAALERFLEKTPEARERLSELEGTSRFLRQLPPRGLDGDFADSVLDRLRTESLLRPEHPEPKRSPRRMRLWISGPLAAAATLLVGVWLIMQQSSRTVLGHRALAPDSGMESDLLDARSAGWEQLKVGDAFEIVGPNGENRFRLIVFGRVPQSDAVRCVLVDTGGQTAKVEVSDPGTLIAPDASTPALQANRAQLDALMEAYNHASSVSEEPVPVVDIYAAAGMAVANITQHVPGSLAEQSPDMQDDSNSVTENRPTQASGATESLPSTSPASSSIARRRSAEPPASPGQSIEMPRRGKEDTSQLETTRASRAEKPAKDDVGRSEGVAADSARQQSDRSQAQQNFIITEVRTKKAIHEMTESTPPRIGLAPEKAKLPPGRIEALLHFHPETSP